MREFSYVITDPEGIHARPAGILVKQAASFGSAIKIAGNGKSADAKRLLAVMSLGIKKGMEVTFTVEGDDEDAAAEAMEAFMKENL